MDISFDNGIEWEALATIGAGVAGAGAAIFTGIIAVAAAVVVGWRQSEILANQNTILSRQADIGSHAFRQSLFERRYAVFETIFPYFTAIYYWADTPQQRAAADRFLLATHQVHFLFGPETGLVGKFREFKNVAEVAKGHVINEAKARADEQPIDAKGHDEMMDIFVTKLPALLEDIRAAMMPYLAFHEPDPGVPMMPVVKA